MDDGTFQTRAREPFLVKQNEKDSNFLLFFMLVIALFLWTRSLFSLEHLQRIFHAYFLISRLLSVHYIPQVEGRLFFACSFLSVHKHKQIYICPNLLCGPEPKFRNIDKRI